MYYYSFQLALYVQHGFYFTRLKCLFEARARANIINPICSGLTPRRISNQQGLCVVSVQILEGIKTPLVIQRPGNVKTNKLVTSLAAYLQANLARCIF